MSDHIDAEFKETGTAVAVREEPRAIEAWTPRFVQTVDDAVQMVDDKREFFRRVMREGVHYGTIPGTDKPALWKPGAELLLSNMGMMPEGSNESPPVLDVMGTEHGGEPFILFQRVCRIYRIARSGERVIVAQEGGSCNSWEPKYRYRNAKRVCPSCGKAAIIKGKAEYGGGWLCFKKQDGCGTKFRDGDKSIESQEQGKVANDDVADLINTIEKMAAKRALIAATLLATGCSDIFTQDMEAQTGEPPPDEPPGDPRPAAAKPADDKPATATADKWTPRADEAIRLGLIADRSEFRAWAAKTVPGCETILEKALPAHGKAIDAYLADPPPPEDDAPAEGDDAPMTAKQKGMLFALHAELGHDDDERHAIYMRIAHVTSASYLSKRMAGLVIDDLNAALDARNAT